MIARRLAGSLPLGSAEARHHARWRELSSDEQAAAVAALRELSGGRGDLLAEVCGLAEGFAVGTLDELRARCATRLCRLAGADEAAIPQWLEEGKRRRDAAPLPALAGFRIA
jgi:hypothetical protein